ncbi:hypothetical protein [Paraburkholderia sartisoli]|uniref:Uncharacterized protein n=1 Tax=Paraburkholderia sartisoli TaxID=83784 RepID=A0A1H4FZQ9_9BURK|nr:hypothetical protein [Paraburkholderia sartisoli]SEB02829.1 hypothetical protein SAMN05192564_105208 [Paraburkholderia sartisoli]
MKANIFQIACGSGTSSQNDAGFVALDDVAGDARWGGYRAIRNYFLSHSVNEDELYGFFASDFRDRTALRSEDVHAFIRDNPGQEVYVFSPAIRDSACYASVFEQNNALLPGFIDVASYCSKRMGLDVDLRTLVTDSRSTVDGYDIVAKPSFWQTWFALSEKLFELFETPDPQTRAQLAGFATDDMKGPLVRCIASLVLAFCPDIAVRAFDTSSMPWANRAFEPYAEQLTFLIQLKTDYVRTSDPSYLDNFRKLRDAILKICVSDRTDRAPAEPFTLSDLLYVCYTHVPLPFEYPSFVSPMYLGESQGEGKANLRDLAPEWEPYHPQLGSLAGCFALKNYIVKSGLKLRRIGICQYRKFISIGKIGGVPAENYRMMDVISPQTLGQTDLQAVMLPEGDDLLLGQYGLLSNGYLDQYNSVHPVEDLLRFTSEAIALGVLERGELLAFFNATAFVPGGIEMGVFPADFWLEAMSAIEVVVRACVTRYPEKREGYQSRSWAFCAERLGSYLLLKYLVGRYGADNWQKKFTGQLNLYSDEETAIYAGTGQR